MGRAKPAEGGIFDGDSRPAKELRPNRPDFVLADAALFVGVFGEVKKSDVSVGEIAGSTDRDNQIGRQLTTAVMVRYG